MSKHITEFKKYRAEMNDKILNSGFRDFKKFFCAGQQSLLKRSTRF